MKPVYIPSFISHPEEVFAHLLTLPWLEMTPARKEYFMADETVSYTYGSGTSARTYTSNPYSLEIAAIRKHLDQDFGTNYNVCFLNRYDNFQNQLGWHSDSSPEMNNEHPIAVISFGAEREIWWKEKSMTGIIPSEQRQKLGAGSLFTMPATFQEHYLHKIPKADSQNISTRISLTFRNYKK